MSLVQYISQGKEKGGSLVEFSLSILIFIIVVMGIIEFGRALFLINLAGRATQLGTRLATICDIGDPQREIIRNKVRYFVEATGQVKVPTDRIWLDIQPNFDTCYSVDKIDPCWITTSLKGLEFKLMIPLMDIWITLPEYRVTQVREAMISANNPACSP